MFSNLEAETASSYASEDEGNDKADKPSVEVDTDDEFTRTVVSEESAELCLDEELIIDLSLLGILYIQKSLDQNHNHNHNHN